MEHTADFATLLRAEEGKCPPEDFYRGKSGSGRFARPERVSFGHAARIRNGTLLSPKATGNNGQHRDWENWILVDGDVLTRNIGNIFMIILRKWLNSCIRQINRANGGCVRRRLKGTPVSCVCTNNLNKSCISVANGDLLAHVGTTFKNAPRAILYNPSISMDGLTCIYEDAIQELLQGHFPRLRGHRWKLRRTHPLFSKMFCLVTLVLMFWKNSLNHAHPLHKRTYLANKNWLITPV